MTLIEDRLERSLRTAGLFAGPALALALYAWNPGAHPEEGRRLLSILALAVCFWMTEAIPLPATALLASALAITCGVAPARSVLAPYADPVIFLFVGSFLLSGAFQKYGLDRSVAGVMLRLGPVGRSPGGLMAGFGAASAAISTCLSNTASAALMTPIALGAIHDRLPRDLDDAESSARATPWASGILLMVAYGASVGGMATIIGTPPNLLVAGFLERMTGVRVGFVGWILFGLPIAFVLLVASTLVCRLILAGGGVLGSPPARSLSAATIEDRERELGRRWTTLCFALAGALWMLPATTAMLLGHDHPGVAGLTAHLPEAGVALLCACLLFVLPVNWRARRFALSWTEGRQVNWGIILLFGGGLSLGTMAEATGIARWAGEGIHAMGLSSTPAGLLAVTVAVSILVSEFASNTAAATLLVPVAISAAEASGFNPVPPALAVGLAATCGFIFPVSTPPNAIVFGTGLLPLPRMIRVGVLLDVTSFFVVWLGLLALDPLLPSH
ncbi:MAG TPA: DASS family sodium-coupled anion symporter [Candidatus Polarisedimenticolia bacterium]|nr:DASS family sodium-coupled anion symporter [Candidatus Polarisedimenticolia bacterium]